MSGVTVQHLVRNAKNAVRIITLKLCAKVEMVILIDMTQATPYPEKARVIRKNVMRLLKTKIIM